jgi:hypothetical protein
MKLGVITTIIALAAATGCVAQVGQPDEKTGTARSSLGDGLNAGGGDDQGGGGGDPGGGNPGGGGGDQNTNGDNNTSGSGDNPKSGDNQGPQPVPWDTTSSSSPSGSQQKK